MNLYGHGTTKGIVASEIVRSKDNTMQVWHRDEDDNIRTEYKPFRPYCYISDKDSVNKKFYDDTPIMELGGSNPLNQRIYSNSFANVSWIKKNADKVDVPLRQSQWMIQSGETQYFDNEFEFPLRMYVDIEVLTSEGHKFTNSSREGDKITIIAILTNRGDKIILALNEDGLTPKLENVYRCKDEPTLINKFINCVQSINPDIIVLHNGFGYDLPYIRDRANLYDIKLQLGRDGSVPNTFQTKIKFAEKEDEYENFQIYGRHVLDTMFMAKRFDSVARRLNSVGLKECAKFLGGVTDNRTYIPGGEIADVWRNQHEKFTREDLIKYALEDVEETQLLDREWGIGIFELTKMVPLPMQDVARYGTGGMIDLFFEREYYHYNWSIPIADKKRDYGGGYAAVFRYGYISEPTVYMDVGSLYPTVNEILGIQPPKDELRIYSDFTTTLKKFRYDTKDKISQTDDPILKRRLKAQDGQYKVLLNTGAYGWLGWEWGKFNYYDGAEAITSLGRDVAKRMNYEAEQLGGEVIRTDTDGSLVVVPKKYQGSEESEREFINLVQQNVNKWISQK